MKAARLCLLLLLVVLLPWRTALAAGWLCAPAGAGEIGWSQVGPERVEPVHPGCAGHDHAWADTLTETDDDVVTPGTDAQGVGHACHSCAASCCANALPSSLPVLPVAPRAVAWRFPPLAVPAAEHRVSGQERPPRAA